ncbi:MAG: PspC domain-containing protein [Bacteroidales bacterium]|nr:PspC domain-containing protein [Bacteroidales bacterium]
MKKTIQINLAGSIFHIDDDAYERLREYLTAVEHRFAATPDGREIIHDLELRMSELFTERLKPQREVINLEDVDEVLEILGKPHEMGGKKQEDTSWQSTSYSGGRRHRRMYRDPDDKPIGGVSSGLAYYFNTDPLLIRILFIIALFLGFGLLLYIVLWIALPLAQTPEQIREMRTGSAYF